MLGIEPKSATCKANFPPTVLSLQPPKVNPFKEETTPSSAQGLLLTLFLGITPGSAWEIICGAGSKILAGRMQDKHSSH